MKSRLAVYLLLDVSASMHGSRLQALHEGCDLTQKCVGRVFQDWQEIYVSALAYESHVKQLYRNQLLGSTPKLPTFSGEGSTSLLPAFQLLAKWLQEDLRRCAPLAILFTDGVGTDNWMEACQLLEPYRGRFLMIGLRCGKSSSLAPLYLLSHEKPITDIGSLEDLLLSEMPLLQNMASRCPE